MTFVIGLILFIGLALLTERLARKKGSLSGWWSSLLTILYLALGIGATALLSSL
jgi:hypothetical protein